MIPTKNIPRKSPFDNNLSGLKHLTGCEIGVFNGDHALSMFQNLDIEMLYLVDPYKVYEGFFGMDDQNILDTALKTAKEGLEPYSDRLYWFHGQAKFAVRALDDSSLDFVYHDGDHKYEVVIQDLREWDKKVKVGGLIGGHDFTHKKPGVIKAVNEYVKENSYKLFMEKTDWWLWKK